MKPKKIKMQMLEPGKNVGLYQCLDEMREAHHKDLMGCQILLAVREGVKADKDGKVTLARVRRCDDILRCFRHLDFVIEINKEFLESIDKATVCALLDHELSHIRKSEDENGEQQEDERGRACWRLVRHDLEEFYDVVKRHGVWRHEIMEMAQAFEEMKKTPLLNEDTKEKGQ